MTNYRTQTTTNTPTNVTAGGVGADIFTMNIINRHSAAIFVKFYDIPNATFQNTPVRTFQVAANSNLSLFPNPINSPLFSTQAGCSIRVVTGATDADNTAAGTLPIIEFAYN